MGARYFLALEGFLEVEVTKEQWVLAERRAGFHNMLGLPDEPATASFSAGGVRGRIDGDDEMSPVVLARLRQLEAQREWNR